MENVVKTKKETVGRRKSAIARINITTGNGEILINGKEFQSYMNNNPKYEILKSPLYLLGKEKDYNFNIKSMGGGLVGQSEAIKLGISRALCYIITDEEKRKLKEKGFLTRNSQCKERRKYGLKKARKASQFSKR
uniref:Small ribosomal subunit protein uS9c n=1 Tax=Cryptoglena skujai TaxID=161229 RepID=A0A0G3SFF3_9EUGL|nr:ribosomal protein S9 [Cryptoglena skujai]AKL39019.1 ribosomal protein S9 [Cryptoglena skujai]